MKKLSFLLAFLCLNSFGAELKCEYRDRWFLVTADVQYKHPVFPHYLNAAIACSETLGGIYDGDSLVVFNGKERRFEEENVGNDFDFSQLSASQGVVALYEGGEFWVYEMASGRFRSTAANYRFKNSRVEAGGNLAALYDGKSFKVYADGFKSVKARERYQHARAAAGDRIAVLYDGDDLWVYDASNDDFTRRGAKGDYLFTRVFSSGNGMLAYDGHELIGYCKGGQWTEKDVAKDAFSQAKADPTTGDPVMQIDKTWYRLDTTHCELSVKR